MKKYLLILCLIPSLSFGQLTRYNDFAEMLFDRMEIEPPDSEKIWYSEAFDTLQYKNVLQKLDYFKIYSADTLPDAFLNWVNDRFNAASLGAGSLVFAKDTGITSNGTSTVIDSRYNPLDSGIHYTLTKASFGAYVRNKSKQNVYDIGITSSGYTAMKILSIDTTTRFSVNSFSGTRQSYTNVAPNRTGLFITNKAGDGNIVLNINGNSVRTITDTNVPIPDYRIYSCGVNNIGTATNFSQKQFAAEFAGGGLSLTDMQIIFRVIERFLDHKNVGVVP